jgi:hypothetical protein
LVIQELKSKGFFLDRLLSKTVATAIATVKHFVMDNMRLLGVDSLVDYRVIICGYKYFEFIFLQ